MLVEVDRSQLREAWVESDATARWRLRLALSASNGAHRSALIYFELDPGCRLPRHRDDAEEVVVLLSGSAIAIVGAEEQKLSEGGILFVPADIPHEIRNDASQALRALAFFATATPTSTFEEPVMPGGTRVRGISR